MTIRKYYFTRTYYFTRNNYFTRKDYFTKDYFTRKDYFTTASVSKVLTARPINKPPLKALQIPIGAMMEDHADSYSVAHNLLKMVSLFRCRVCDPSRAPLAENRSVQ